MEDHSDRLPRTGLSAGLAIYEALSESEAVTSRVTRIFPLVSTTEIKSPAVCYLVEALEPTPVKTGTVSDMVAVEIYCIAGDYPACVDIAEAVCATLDGLSGETSHGMLVSHCMMTDQTEDYQEGAYIKLLNFKMRIR